MLKVFKHSWRAISVQPIRLMLTIVGIVISSAFFIIASIFTSSVLSMQVDKYDNFNPHAVYINQPLYSEQVRYLTEKFSDTKVVAYYDGATYVMHSNEGNDVAVYGRIVGTCIDFHNYFVPSVDLANSLEQATLICGRAFIEDDFLLSRKVAILNYSYSKLFFGDENPIGKTLLMENGGEFYVVGLLKDTDDIIRSVKKLKRQIDNKEHVEMLIPIYVPETCLNAVYRACASSVAILFQNVDMKSAKVTISKEISGSSLAVSVFTKDEIIESIVQDSERVNQTIYILMGLMLLMSGISLSIILVFSFKERIPEIAIKKAIGASDGHILIQFLLESLYTGGIGGLIGVILGLLLVVIVAPIAMQATISTILMSVHWTTIAIPLLASLLIGQLFSIIPAIVVSRKNVISSLRGE